MDLYGELKENFNLKNYNTYKIECIAKYFIKPNNIDSLKELVKYLKDKNEKYIIIGKGSNIILPDYYNGTIIVLDKLNNIKIDNQDIFAESGITLNNLIIECINNDLKGLENLYGIPGTLGGAILQNAGCYGSTISDYLESVIYLKNNNIYEIKKEECNFLYRNGIFKNNKDMIILSAKFKLINGNKKEMKEIIKEHIKKRNKTQPLEYPNAGSVFKNPLNLHAGKIIEENNLKGYNIKDAYVSEKHANFIINKGRATSKDITELIDYIKETIYKETNIKLEIEQEIIK